MAIDGTGRKREKRKESVEKREEDVMCRNICYRQRVERDGPGLDRGGQEGTRSRHRAKKKKMGGKKTE